MTTCDRPCKRFQILLYLPTKTGETVETMSSEDSGDDGPGVMKVVRTVVPDFVRKRFALKFTIVLLVMGLAIGATGLVGTQQFTEHTREQAESEYSSLAVQEANLVGQWIGPRKNTSSSSRPAPGRPDWSPRTGRPRTNTRPLAT